VGEYVVAFLLKTLVIKLIRVFCFKFSPKYFFSTVSKIIALKTQLEENNKPKSDNQESDSNNQNNNRGTVIMDATACPQDRTFGR
jgi:hypothetical protein